MEKIKLEDSFSNKLRVIQVTTTAADVIIKLPPLCEFLQKLHKKGYCFAPKRRGKCLKNDIEIKLINF